MYIPESSSRLQDNACWPAGTNERLIWCRLTCAWGRKLTQVTDCLPGKEGRLILQPDLCYAVVEQKTTGNILPGVFIALHVGRQAKLEPIVAALQALASADAALCHQRTQAVATPQMTGTKCKAYRMTRHSMLHALLLCTAGCIVHQVAQSKSKCITLKLQLD